MSPSLQAFVAVILGALLATLGGLAATQVNIALDRSRRARSAALLCGEILAAVGTLLRLADEAAASGTFFDPLASRYLTAARREIDVYDRNRELLFDVGDPDLRARVHAFTLRLTIPLDRLADSHGRYRELCPEGVPTARADDLRQELAGTYEYLMSNRPQIPALLALLQPLARSTFDSYTRIDSHGVLVKHQIKN